MAKPISKFFDRLELPSRNMRWSWDARNGDALLLRALGDEYSGKEKAVTVLRESAR